MATVFMNKAGQYVAQWRFGNAPKAIYLGKIEKPEADEFLRRLEKLIDCQARDRAPDAATRLWLASRPPRLLGKLAKHGLTEEANATTIGQLCDYCIQQADVKPGTMQKYQDAQTSLEAYFGAARSIHAISPGDADEFRRWLAKKGRRKPKEGPLASSTVSKRVEQCRQYFKTAVRKRWLTENPFEGVSAPVTIDKDRERYISREDTQTLMDAADPELRLIIALARSAACACPAKSGPSSGTGSTARAKPSRSTVRRTNATSTSAGGTSPCSPNCGHSWPMASTRPNRGPRSSSPVGG
jgi:hypothetical protein